MEWAPLFINQPVGPATEEAIFYAEQAGECPSSLDADPIIFCDAGLSHVGPHRGYDEANGREVAWTHEPERP